MHVPVPYPVVAVLAQPELNTDLLEVQSVLKVMGDFVRKTDGPVRLERMNATAFIETDGVHRATALPRLHFQWLPLEYMDGMSAPIRHMRKRWSAEHFCLFCFGRASFCRSFIANVACVELKMPGENWGHEFCDVLAGAGKLGKAVWARRQTIAACDPKEILTRI